jgi:hypothetical protein
MISSICTSIVALVFLAAGALKLPNISGFRDGLGLVPYIPSWAVPFIAIALPSVEIGVGILLLCNSVVASLGSLCLSVCFLVIGAFVIKKGLNIPCNCFGVDDGRLFSLRQVVLAAILMILSAVSAAGSHGVWGVGRIAFIAGIIILLMAGVISSMVNNILALRGLSKLGIVKHYV